MFPNTNVYRSVFSMFSIIIGILGVQAFLPLFFRGGQGIANRLRRDVCRVGWFQKVQTMWAFSQRFSTAICHIDFPRSLIFISRILLVVLQVENVFLFAFSSVFTVFVRLLFSSLFRATRLGYILKRTKRKIREKNEHLVSRPFTSNNNEQNDLPQISKINASMRLLILASEKKSMN